jgi:3-deoxy-D-manno-octulosonic-acid transferase
MGGMERAYSVATGAANFVLPLLAVGGGKLARGIRGRRGAVERLERWGRQERDPRRPLLWFHAPSVGEGFQARAVMEEIRRQRPDAQIVYTFFSPSAESFAASAPADRADYLPIDLPSNMSRVVDALRPDVIAFSKTEVWPNLTRAAAARGVPQFLLSATLPARSSRLRFPARQVLRPAHQRLTAVAAISPEDAARFSRLGIPADRRLTMGDARFDQVWSRATGSRARGGLAPPLADADRPVVIAGSTWPPDEDRLITAFSRIAPGPGTPLLVLVPHEPSRRHLERVECELSEHGLTFARLSAAASPDSRILIVDRVGLLGDLYAFADVAYVGGGFGSAGLHSVLEPAAFGVPVLFGPRHGNAREAASLIEAGGAFSVKDAEGLRSALADLLSDADRLESAGSAAKAFVAAGRGAAARGARLLLEALAPDRRP